MESVDLIVKEEVDTLRSLQYSDSISQNDLVHSVVISNSSSDTSIITTSAASATSIDEDLSKSSSVLAASAPEDNTIGFDEAKEENIIATTNRSDEEILEGAAIGESDVTDNQDVSSDDDEEDDGVVVHISKPTTTTRKSNISKYLDRGQRSYIRPQLRDSKTESDEMVKRKEKEEIKALRFTNHRTAFDVDIDALESNPWRKKNVNLSDYFNFGFDEDTWRIYCEKQLRIRASKGLGPFNLSSISHQSISKIQPTSGMDGHTIIGNSSSINIPIKPELKFDINKTVESNQTTTSSSSSSSVSSSIPTIQNMYIQRPFTESTQMLNPLTMFHPPISNFNNISNHFPMSVPPPPPLPSDFRGQHYPNPQGYPTNPSPFPVQPPYFDGFNPSLNLNVNVNPNNIPRNYGSNPNYDNRQQNVNDRGRDFQRHDNRNDNRDMKSKGLRDDDSSRDDQRDRKMDIDQDFGRDRDLSRMKKDTKDGKDHKDSRDNRNNKDRKDNSRDRKGSSGDRDRKDDSRDRDGKSSRDFKDRDRKEKDKDRDRVDSERRSKRSRSRSYDRDSKRRK